MGQEQQQRDDDDDEDAYDESEEDSAEGDEDREKETSETPGLEAAPAVPPPDIPAPVEKPQHGVASTGLPVATPARAGGDLLARFLSKDVLG